MHSSRMRTVRFSGRLVVCPGACWDTHPLPTPVNRMTDACENNLAATTLRTVISPDIFQVDFIIKF